MQVLQAPNLKINNEPRTYFSSDWHLFHKNILKHTNRSDAMFEGQTNEDLVFDVIWRQFKSGDHLYVLGDTCFGTLDQLLFFFGKIERYVREAKISFLIGNHDNDTHLYKLQELYKAKKGLKIEVLGHKAFVRRRLYTERDIVIDHYPGLVWKDSHHGAWQLHGHCHGSLQMDLGKSLDVGLDNAVKVFGEYKLFEIGDIREIMQSKEIQVHDHHKPRQAPVVI